MKNILYTFFVALLITACGSSKKVSPTTSEISKIEEISTDTISAPAMPVDSVVKEPIKTIPDVTVEPIEIEDPTPIEIIEVFNHSVWNTLVQTNVSATGEVNYEGFRQQRGQLREYIASLGAQMPEISWDKEDTLAYWMNAYNAMTVDLILRNLPLASIKDIDKPWNQRLWKLGSKWYNLDEIEHQILRKMGDPRIHFGINCASFSCPPLLNEAFSSAKVDAQLELLAVNFVNDTRRNHISEDTIVISKIFDWFAKDFKQNGSLIDFLNRYSKTPINSKARKKYMQYDWNLNQ
jgi:hypothetical protein